MLILTFGIGVLAYLSVNGKCILGWECLAVSDVILHLAIIRPVMFSAIWDSHLVSSRMDLAWHYCLGHMPFPKLKKLVLSNFIPKRLAKVHNPKCARCKYGAMTKQLWRTKSKLNKGHLQAAKALGDCISVDQLQLSIPGFVTQLKGRLTRERCIAAAMCVDHYSDLCYVYLMKHMTLEETALAKKAFEAYAMQRGSQSSTTMQTTVDLQIKDSPMLCGSQGRLFPTAQSMPTIEMGKQKR
eukprot:14257883-Ditylum_brightwellii.AAC.1